MTHSLDLVTRVNVTINAYPKNINKKCLIILSVIMKSEKSKHGTLCVIAIKMIPL